MRFGDYNLGVDVCGFRYSFCTKTMGLVSMYGFYVLRDSCERTSLFITRPAQKRSAANRLRLPAKSFLLHMLCFGSCASQGFLNPPAKPEQPLPPRIHRRRRSTAIAVS